MDLTEMSSTEMRAIDLDPDQLSLRAFVLIA